MAIVTTKLNSIFENILAQQHITNYKLNVTSGSNIGDGFIGNISRVKVTGNDQLNDEPVTLSFIYKYPPDDATEREIYRSMDCFKREIYFYNNLIPEFEKIQQQFGICKEVDGFYSYPKCYYAEFDRDNNFAALVLEDLTCNGPGYNMHGTSNILASNVTQAKLLVRELGKFHAVSFSLQHHEPEIFEKFKSLDNILSRALSTQQLAQIAVRNCQLARNIVDSTNAVKINLIDEVSPYVWNKIREITDSKYSEPFNVVGHGDCYINNMMFSYENEQFTNIRLIDFQTIVYGSPVLDLISFLMLSTPKEMRGEYLNVLLNEYYASLCKLLEKLNCDPNEIFPENIFRQHLKLFGRIGVGLGIFAFPQYEKYPFDANNEDNDENHTLINNYKKRLLDVLDDTLKFFKD